MEEFRKGSGIVRMPNEKVFLGEFVFAAYVDALKKALKSNKASDTVISKLYGLIAIPAKLDGKNELTIECSKSTASSIMNRKSNAHHDIRAHSHDPLVKNSIGERFQRVFGNDLHEANTQYLITTLTALIKSSNLAKEKKEYLLHLSKNENIWDFLAFSYLESLHQENKLYPTRLTEPPNSGHNNSMFNSQQEFSRIEPTHSNNELTAAVRDEINPAVKSLFRKLQA